jgi:hypothetical protein
MDTAASRGKLHSAEIHDHDRCLSVTAPPHVQRRSKSARKPESHVSAPA